MHEAARNLRTAERYLLAPPLAATYGDVRVAVCDISAKGARFRHDAPLDGGAKALLRIAVVYNVPIACNRATADFLLSSHLMDEEYERRLPDLDGMI